MSDEEFTRHSAATAVRPPSTQDPVLRSGWDSGTNRPARLHQQMNTDDADTVGPLVGALGAIALVLIAAGVIVVLFAF